MGQLFAPLPADRGVRFFAPAQWQDRLCSRLPCSRSRRRDPRPQTAEKLSVLVGAQTGRVGFGAKYNAYSERFENVMVTYGGDDEDTLARIKAAVVTLKR